MELCSYISIILTHLSSIMSIMSPHKPCFYIDSSERFRNLYKKKMVDKKWILPSTICSNTYNVTYIETMEAYYKKFQPVKTMFEQCCGIANIQKNYIHNTSDIAPVWMSTSHIIIPILGKENIEKLYGYYFLPMIYAPGAIYVTKKDNTLNLINLLKIYPLIIICCLLAVISGFIQWILETWGNENEFSRSFLNGWFDGCWWSFITMATVGYGDKSPKSIAGRLFSVVWIFMGLILSGMITGWVIETAWKTGKPLPPDMEGKDVGLVKGDEYVALILTKHSGHPIEVDATNFNASMYELIQKLQKGEISGILVDRYQLWMFELRERDESLTDREGLEFFLKETTRTEKHIKHPTLMYGMLIKDKEIYDYFVDYMKDNHFIRENFLSFKWVNDKKKNIWKDSFFTSSDLFIEPSGWYFLYSVISLGSLVVGICLFGFVYERSRKSRKEMWPVSVQE